MKQSQTAYSCTCMAPHFYVRQAAPSWSHMLFGAIYRDNTPEMILHTSVHVSFITVSPLICD